MPWCSLSASATKTWIVRGGCDSAAATVNAMRQTATGSAILSLIACIREVSCVNGGMSRLLHDGQRAADTLNQRLVAVADLGVLDAVAEAGAIAHDALQGYRLGAVGEHQFRLDRLSDAQFRGDKQGH